MDLYTQIISYPSLLYGFYRVKESDGAAGVDAVTIDDFEEDLQRNISRLYYELLENKYRPLPLLAFERKTSPEWTSPPAPLLGKERGERVGKIRLLTIPAVRDRVIQASALNILEPVIDAELENESFAYRKGFSRESAARRINNLFNKGYCWLLDADIRKFFDTVNHNILFQRIQSVLNNEKVVLLIKKWVEADYTFKGKKFKQTVGLPQGSVISPILANLYLDKFDEEIAKKGFHLVRFADDFVILAKTKPDALEALKISQEILSELKLQLNEEKTNVISFSEGFKYLGYLFLNSLILPASSKDKSKPLPFLDNSEASIEIERFKEITAKREEEKKLKQSLKNSEVGEKLLEAIEEKGISFSEFLTSVRNQNPQIQLKKISGLVSEPETTGNISTEESGLDKTLIILKPLPNAGTAFSFKRTLYIQTQGAVMKKEGERIIVEKGEIILADIPAIKINQVIIFGICSITPSAMQFCLINNIPVTLLSTFGKYFGKIETEVNRNIELERLQYFSSVDEKLNLSLAKEVVSGKIWNLRILLQRVLKRFSDVEISFAIKLMKDSLIEISKAGNLEQLRGIEGNSSSVYFSVYGRAFLKQSSFYNTSFKRIKRPPTDPVNSLLSFGYTLLSSNIYSTISALGLNPYVGFFHTIRQGHPALASDLIEEFRHIIDSLVIQIINKKILTRKDFYFVKEPDVPCLLTKEGRKEFLRQFEIKMHKVTTHSPTGKKADYRRCIFLQVQQFAKVLKGEKPNYEPFKIKL